MSRDPSVSPKKKSKFFGGAVKKPCPALAARPDKGKRKELDHATEDDSGFFEEPDLVESKEGLSRGLMLRPTGIVRSDAARRTSWTSSSRRVSCAPQREMNTLPRGSLQHATMMSKTFRAPPDRRSLLQPRGDA